MKEAIRSSIWPFRQLHRKRWSFHNIQHAHRIYLLLEPSGGTIKAAQPNITFATTACHNMLHATCYMLHAVRWWHEVSYNSHTGRTSPCNACIKWGLASPEHVRMRCGRPGEHKKLLVLHSSGRPLLPNTRDV